jgi:hypothetical protein
VESNPADRGERSVARLAHLEAEASERTFDAVRAWDDVLVRASQRPARVPTWLVFATSAMAGAILVLAGQRLLPPNPAHSVEPLIASADARWALRPDGVVVLSAGRLTVTRGGPAAVRIETPTVVIESRDARFLAEVVEGATQVLVEEGTVAARSGAATQQLHAGERGDWPAAPVIPRALEPRSTEASSLCPGADAVREVCLVEQARGSGLDAQTAQFELGALYARTHRRPEAIAAWQSSVHRFPGGVFEPEARLGVLVELVHAQRWSEAAAAAEAFERAFPDDPRRDDVARLRMHFP